MRRLPIILSSLLLTLSTVAVTAADTRLTIEERTRITIPGNESDTTTETILWLSADRAARIDASGRIISRLDRSEAYLVNDAQRTYSVVKLEPTEAADVSSATLEPTGEIRTIGSWTAQRYDLTFEIQPGEEGHAVLWISPDVGIDLEIYRRFTESIADAMGMSWLKSLASVQGYPVLQETSMGIVTVTSTLLSVADESPPPGTYDPPAGYSRQE